MLVLVAFILGCALGWVRAARRGGTTPDKIQYALAHGIPIGLVTLALVTVYARLYGMP
jgi:hypothetical protein